MKSVFNSPRDDVPLGVHSEKFPVHLKSLHMSGFEVQCYCNYIYGDLQGLCGILDIVTDEI
jgi:hypothetical protein